MDKVLALTVAEIAKGFLVGSVSGMFAILILGTGTLKEFIVLMAVTMAISFFLVYKINKKIYQS